MTVDQQQRYRIPDVLKNWPWPRHLNPHYPEAKAASEAWAHNFNAFSSKAQSAAAACSLLSSLAYPHQDATGLRIVCDLMFQFLIYDEYTDACDTLEEAQEMADIVMDALRNPHKPRPEGEWLGGEVTRQFWALAIQTAAPGAQERFIRAYGGFAQSLVQQTADRKNKRVLTVEEYFAARQDTIGAKPCFAVLEFDMDIPQHVMDDEVIQELVALTCDMITLSNDMLSYNKEQARGDVDHNIVTILMYHHNKTLQEAMDWVGERHLQVEKRFLELYRHHVPKYCSYQLDADVAKYVDGLGNWVRANDQWGFENERYFGKRGPEIQKNRWVTLLPKKRVEAIGPQLVDGSLL